MGGILTMSQSWNKSTYLLVGLWVFQSFDIALNIERMMYASKAVWNMYRAVWNMYKCKYT